MHLRLADDPPDHSQAKPIERTGDLRQNHWNGPIWDELTTVFQCAQSMTGKGQQPIVKFVTQTDPTGVKLTQQALAAVENQIQRFTDLEVQGEPLNRGKWFVDILYQPEP